MKLQIIYLTICSLSQAAYISRMALINQNQPNNVNVNRIRPMNAFRPGVVMRPWNHPRLVQASSHRVPFVMYRNHPHRYSMKHFPTRMATAPWKAATRQPTTATAAPTNAEYEFVRSVSLPPKQQTQAHQVQAHSGAIHTIPAPNLSLAEKPIVVLDDNSNYNSISVSSERPKTVYEVTEKYPDPAKLHLAAKIEQPIGFSKSNSFTQADYQSLQNSAALQLASELGLSAISLPQHSIPQQVVHQQQQPVVTQQSIPQQHVQQHFVQPQSIVPQQFTMHNFHTLPNAQEFMQAAPDGIVITPNALYQPDPAFLQKLQNQLLQRFPGVEFVPYAAGFDLPQNQNQQSHLQVQNQQNQIQNQIQNQLLFPSLQNQNFADQQTFQTQTQSAFKPSPFQYQTAQTSLPQTQIHAANQPSHSQITFQTPVTVQPFTQPPFVLLQNEQFARQTPSFAVAESQNRYVVQRQTQEGTVVTLVPQTQFTNRTGNLVEVSTFSTPQNITLELIASESKPEGSTIKYIIETTTEQQKTTPVHYTTVSQSANGIGQTEQNNGNTRAAQASQIAANILQASQHSNQIYQNSAQINKNIVQTNQKTVSTNQNTVQDSRDTVKVNQNHLHVNQNNAQVNRNNAHANLIHAQTNLNNAQANLNNAEANQNNAQAIQNNAHNNQNNAQAIQNNAQTNQNNAQTNQNNAQANQNNAQANQNIANIGNVQVAESAGNVVTDGFYSAINDVRAAAALAQVDKPQESTAAQENFTTTTLTPTSTINEDLKPYFVQKSEKDKQNQTNSEIKSVLGVPFAKAQNSVNTYTLLRSDDKETKVAKDGSVYAGQIVEASVSEDQDFNKQKTNLLTRRAPIRLVAVADKKDTNITTTTRIPPRAAVIKARIPPKSKLTFDDKTGEPVLRIYASYVDTSAQKEATTSKLTNTKHVKEIAPRKPDSLDSWKAAALARPHGFEPNPNAVTSFGLKLRSRSDDYVPLFDDYED